MNLKILKGNKGILLDSFKIGFYLLGLYIFNGLCILKIWYKYCNYKCNKRLWLYDYMFFVFRVIDLIKKYL